LVSTLRDPREITPVILNQIKKEKKGIVNKKMNGDVF